VSGLAGATRAAAAALGASMRALLIVVAIGALAGAAWGLADEPQYEATAFVVLTDRGEAAESAGSGAAGGAGPDAIERALELARSDDVAAGAAVSLGADVRGADLIARTDFRGRGSSLVVRSSASFPDFAAAAANAFAGSMVEFAAVFERRRLKAAEERLGERIAELDPASDRAVQLNERLDSVIALQALGNPMRFGRSADLPLEPVSDRSVSKSALWGGGLAGLLAVLVVLGREVRRRPVRRASQLETAASMRVLTEFGAATVAPRAVAAGAVRADGPGAERVQALLGELGFDSPEGAVAGLAVLSANPEEGRTATALGLAAAAAKRGVGVMVVEADMRRPAFSRRLMLDAEPGLSDYLVGAAGPREVIRTVSVEGVDERGERRPSFVCVTAGGEADDPAGLLSGARFRGLTEQLRRVYDLVIYDTPPLLVAPEAAIVAATLEAGILCVRAGSTTGREVHGAVGRLQPEWWLGAVMTGSPHRGPGLRRIPRAG
jgi:Mrp family chromosome partitioning ATPase